MSNQGPWFLLGQGFFGLLIGSMVGLSISPVVGAVLGLLFAFLGGSIIMLIKDKDAGQLAFIGKCISVLSVFIMLGVVAGVNVREGNLFLLGQKHSAAPYVFAEDMSLELVKKLSAKSGDDSQKSTTRDYSSLLCYLIKIKSRTQAQAPLSSDELMGLMQSGVDDKVIFALLELDSSCEKLKLDPAPAGKSGKTFLYSDDNGDDVSELLREP